MRRLLPIFLTLLLLTGIVTILLVQNNRNTGASTSGVAQPLSTRSQNSTAYIYYTLKQSSGFVLARAPKGNSGQPLSTPQPIAQFTNGFGQASTDSILSMQLSPDGQYLAIDATGDHGEQVWVFDIQQTTMKLVPADVMGNFLHWLPTGHVFLYRPMFPIGPNAPMDGGEWNPGLWEVDAVTGAYTNIDIQVPSAYLIDAAPSPDGSRIIYSTTAGLGLGSQTWLMDSDGNGRQHLFSTAGGAQSIAALFTWSPDSKSIVYEQLSDSTTPFLPAGLWVMNSQGSEQRRLANTDGGHGYAPVWSPDGHKIAFVERTNTADHRADTQLQALQSAISVVDVSSGQSWMVASMQQTGMQFNVNPAWASDSTSITFTAFNAINQDIGGTPRYWLARTTGLQMQPAVTPITAAILHVVAIG